MDVKKVELGDILLSRSYQNGSLQLYIAVGENHTVYYVDNNNTYATSVNKNYSSIVTEQVIHNVQQPITIDNESEIKRLRDILERRSEVIKTKKWVDKTKPKGTGKQRSVVSKILTTLNRTKFRDSWRSRTECELSFRTSHDGKKLFFSITGEKHSPKLLVQFKNYNSYSYGTKDRSYHVISGIVGSDYVSPINGYDLFTDPEFLNKIVPVIKKKYTDFTGQKC